MKKEEILAEIELTLIQANPITIFQEQPASNRAADPVANVVAENGARRRGLDDQSDI